ncbi:MAG: hypothetical protein J7M25_13935, partial [Deltaproteobacteria bacterium]|nr:hypothetical protein [Deltaproteobacteria bacterium]
MNVPRFLLSLSLPFVLLFSVSCRFDPRAQVASDSSDGHIDPYQDASILGDATDGNNLHKDALVDTLTQDGSWIDGDVIWVSPNGDPDGPGSLSHPFDSIERGLQAAATQAKPEVHVITGTYHESIHLVPNVSVLCGFDEHGDPHDDPSQTLIRSTTGGIGVSAPGTYDASLIGCSIEVSGNAPGGSVYGVLASNASNLVLDHLIITVHDAAKGQDGQRGRNGDDGGDGAAGANGCYNCGTQPGGAGGASNCGAVGGNGGSGAKPDVGGDGGHDGQDGSGMTQAGHDGLAGQHGSGGDAASGGGDATSGGDGQPGKDGDGGDEIGTFQADGYHPADGQDGENGGYGGGGGGGGGGGSTGYLLN